MEATDWEVGVTVRLGAAAWVTVILVEAPPPLNVTTPVRSAPLLAVWFRLTEALPVPELGLMLNQLALELAVQGTLAVTEATKLPAASATDLVLGLILNIGAVLPAWVTVTVLDSKPEEIVMTPVRLELELAVWVTVILALPKPELWFTESQLALLFSVQVENEDELILREKLPAVAGAA